MKHYGDYRSERELSRTTGDWERSYRVLCDMEDDEQEAARRDWWRMVPISSIQPQCVWAGFDHQGLPDMVGYSGLYYGGLPSQRSQIMLGMQTLITSDELDLWPLALEYADLILDDLPNDYSDIEAHIGRRSPSFKDAMGLYREAIKEEKDSDLRCDCVALLLGLDVAIKHDWAATRILARVARLQERGGMLEGIANGVNVALKQYYQSIARHHESRMPDMNSAWTTKVLEAYKEKMR